MVSASEYPPQRPERVATPYRLRKESGNLEAKLHATMLDAAHRPVSSNTPEPPPNLPPPGSPLHPDHPENPKNKVPLSPAQKLWASLRTWF